MRASKPGRAINIVSSSPLGVTSEIALCDPFKRFVGMRVACLLTGVPRLSQLKDSLHVGLGHLRDIESFLAAVAHCIRKPSRVNLGLNVTVGEFRVEFLGRGKGESGTLRLVTRYRADSQKMAEAGPVFVNAASTVEKDVISWGNRLPGITPPIAFSFPIGTRIEIFAVPERFIAKSRAFRPLNISRIGIPRID